MASIDQSVAPSLQGGVHISKAEEAPALAAKMLGGTLVTKQVSSSLGVAAYGMRCLSWALLPVR